MFKISFLNKALKPINGMTLKPIIRILTLN